MEDERNVVILGKAGSGKRTLGNRIAGEEIFHHDHESLTGTGDVGVHYEQATREGTLYRILTVDTESLHTRINDPIPYIKKYFKVIHMIMFVIAKGRYTGESHRSLQDVIERLDQQAKSVSALVITHCESMNKPAREKIVAKFQDNSRSSEVADFMGKGIHTVGFPGTSDMLPSLIPAMEQQITHDEKSICELVESCASPIRVEDLRKQAISEPLQSAAHPAAMSGKSACELGLGTFDGAKQTCYQALPNSKEQDVLQPSAQHPEDPQPANTSTKTTKKQNTQDSITDRLTHGLQKIKSTFFSAVAVIRPESSMHSVEQQPSCPEQPMNSLNPDPHAHTLFEKNVVILGKTGSGRKTLRSHIVGENNTFTSVDMTEDFELGWFVSEDTLYRILTIETETISTNLITNLFQNINLIIFVVTFNHFTSECECLLKTLKSLPHQATQISALVITHCEKIQPQDREDFISKFRTTDQYAPISAFMAEGIYTVGFPDDLSITLQERPHLQNDKIAMRKLVDNSNKSIATALLNADENPQLCNVA